MNEYKETDNYVHVNYTNWGHITGTILYLLISLGIIIGGASLLWGQPCCIPDTYGDCVPNADVIIGWIFTVVFGGMFLIFFLIGLIEYEPNRVKEYVYSQKGSTTAVQKAQQIQANRKPKWKPKGVKK